MNISSTILFSTFLETTDERYDLYKWFQAKEMDQFLNQIRKAGILLLEAGRRSDMNHEVTHRIQIRSTSEDD